jgi:hypothetical protein
MIRNVSNSGAIHVSMSRRLRHRLRTRVSEHPAIYLPLARRRYPGPSPQVVGPETELVIDGYTRCGTTFAVYAFQLAQRRPVKVAHHLHAVAQLVSAARMGVPAIVLIRRPEEAVLSQLVREPTVAVEDALAAYSRFYTALLPYRPSFVAGEFEEVTSTFGSVIRRVNERFGTGFDEFEPTSSNLQRCTELMRQRSTLSASLLAFESGLVPLDQLVTAFEGTSRPDLVDAWVPSTERKRSKERLREDFLHPRLTTLRERADHAYETFLGVMMPSAISSGENRP